MSRSSSRSYASRVAALEALEAARAPVVAQAERDAYQQRLRTRLAALGFTSGEYSRSCICGWVVPGVQRYHASAETTPEHARCIICGSFRASVFDVPAYVCPRCGHAHSGPKGGGGLCPCCGWFPPLAAREGHDGEPWVEAVVYNLARVHSASVAAAWLDTTDLERLQQELARLAPWWVDEVPRLLLPQLRADLEVGHVTIDAAAMWDERGPRPAAAAVWNGSPLPERALEEQRRIDSATLLGGLLRSREQHTGVRITDVAGALDSLDAITAALAATPWRGPPL